LILYLDTSALVKLYAEEEGTETVELAVDEAEAVATSVVAYAEARAALARKLREDVFSPEEHSEAVEALGEDWESVYKPEVTEDLVRAAGDLAEAHALRGFDAIHLASALLVPCPPSPRPRSDGPTPGGYTARCPVPVLGVLGSSVKSGDSNPTVPPRHQPGKRLLRPVRSRHCL